MRSSRTTARLASALILRRWSHTTTLLLIAAVTAGLLVGLTSVRDSSVGALDDSIRADLGGRTYALQTGNREVVATLNGMAHASPVADDNGSITAHGLTSTATVRTTTDPSLELGVLVAGERPKAAGEALLAQAVAESLGIDVGDSVSLATGAGSSTVTVTGLTVVPADVQQRTVILLTADTDAFVPSRWLSDNDFYDEPDLRSALDRQVATVTSLPGLLDASTANRPQFISAMRFVPEGAGLLLGIVLIAVVAALTARRWRWDAAALVGAGMSARSAWRAITTAVLVVVLAGLVVGSISSLLVLQAFRVQVSGWVGQHWVHVVVPTQEVVALLVISIVTAAAAVPIARGLPAVATRLGRRATPPRWSVSVAGLVFLGSACAWLISVRSTLTNEADSLAWLAPVAALVLAYTVPFLVGPMLGWGLEPTSRTLFNHLTAGLRPVTAVCSVVIVASGVWSAQTYYSANMGEERDNPLQPAGTFVISAVPDNVLAPLERMYRSHGGSGVEHWAIPDESTAQLRVTSPALVACAEESKGADLNSLPDRCWPADTAAPVNTVLLGEADADATADPGLVEDGEVGLIQFTGNAGEISRLDRGPAAIDSRLGGNLPGLVIPENSPIAETFSLRPDGRSEVMLTGFARLSPKSRFAVRSEIMRLAPSAETSDSTDPTFYDRLRSVANTASFLGAGATAVILLLGGVSIVVAHGPTRRILVDLGTARRRRRSLALRWALLPVLSSVAACAIAYLTASWAGQVHDVSYGTVWAVPGILGTLTAVVVGVLFVRPPASRS